MFWPSRDFSKIGQKWLFLKIRNFHLFGLSFAQECLKSILSTNIDSKLSVLGGRSRGNYTLKFIFKSDKAKTYRSFWRKNGFLANARKLRQLELFWQRILVLLWILGLSSTSPGRKNFFLVPYKLHSGTRDKDWQDRPADFTLWCSVKKKTFKKSKNRKYLKWLFRPKIA